MTALTPILNVPPASCGQSASVGVPPASCREPESAFLPNSSSAAVAHNATVNLQIVDPTSFSGWDSLLATHPQSTFFHTAAWATTISRTYGWPCLYIAAIRNGALLGLLPLIEAQSWLCGRRGISLPFTDECAPLVSSEVSGETLWDRAVAEGLARRWKYLEVRGGHGQIDRLPESVSYYSHGLALNQPVGALFENLESPVRRAIRKAERSGVTVRFGNDLDSVRAYYRLHCRTRTKHGSPPQPFRFFQSLLEHVMRAGRGFVALASYQDRPVAGAVFVHFGRQAIYKFSASDERYQELRGPNLVVWRAVEKLAAEGFGELSFGKTSLANEGLRRFKNGWGSIERVIHYARYSFQKREFVPLADLASGFQRRLFALLPIACSRWIGRAAYSHLS